jgi:ubiquitin-conjugating enzyme E2 Z
MDSINPVGNIIVTKETINRLIKDIKQIMKNPLIDNGIYYVHDDTDMLKGYALIIGPSETPYFGGNYLFELNYPADYPHSPPSVKYCTNGDNVRFNPNLYKCGKVCVSLLNTWRGDQWTSCQTISTVLLTLCTLLCKDPLLNEPGVKGDHKDFAAYTEIIEYANLKISVCGMVDKDTKYYWSKFEVFYPYIKEQFLANYDALLEFAKSKSKKKKIVKTGLYNMNVLIDYSSVVNKLESCKEKIESKKIDIEE